MSDITPADALRELGDDQAEYAAAAARHNALGEALFFDRLENARADVEHLKAQRDELISERDEAREEAARQGAEVERLHSWGGLLSLLDEHWPEDVFPDRTGKPDRDTGPRLVAAIRRAEKAQAEVARRDRVLGEVRRLGMRWLHLSAEAMDQDVREWTGAAGKSVLAALDTSSTADSP